MTSTLNFLQSNYSNFTFDFDYYNQNLKPFVQTVVLFFKKTKPKKISLYDCYFWSNTLLRHPHNLEHENILQITYNTYYIIKTCPEVLTL